LALLTLTGCGALKEPTDMFVIAGSALDWTGAQYRLANEMGDTGSTKEDLPKSRIFAGEGSTVSACLFHMAARAQREIYFGKTEVLLVQETMPADRRHQALELFLAHRSDGEVLLCALRAESPEAALSFGEGEELRSTSVMGLLKDGARRAVCRPVRASEIKKLGGGSYMLPEVTVEQAGASLTGAAFYRNHAYLGRMEGQPVRMLCLLLGSQVESACSFHGPDWAVWIKKAAVEPSGTGLHLKLEAAFCEGDPDRQTAERYLTEMGTGVLNALREMGCSLPGLPADAALTVSVHMP
jgi:hypothetical protein